MESLKAKEKWAQLMEAERNAKDLRGELFRCGFEDVLALVREGIRTPNPDREFAFRLTQLLPVEQLQKLLPDLVQLACEPSYVPTIEQARQAILALPRRWTIEHIVTAAEPLLLSSDDWVYRRLLELYALLDRELTLKFARRAAEHEHPEIREAGTEFLNDPSAP
jgi:hypothetical protein